MKLVFSIIIPVYNRPEEIDELLASILSQEYDEAFDVCIIEDGSGNSVKNNKYRKEIQGNYIYFKICDEKFSTHKFKSFKDTCHIRVLDNLKIVDLKYINEKKSQSILKYNPFEKIYIIEKISETKVIKYEVIWIDDWLEVDD